MTPVKRLVDLSLWSFRDYQAAAIDDALTWLTDTGRNYADRRLYAAPTGSGKSLIELGLHGSLAKSALVTPRLEIVAGMLEKLGEQPIGWSDDKLAGIAAEYGIFTPVRLRNMLANGTAPYRPDVFIFDEGHHAAANTYQELAAYVPEALWVLYTATPFRGTPADTVAFLEACGNHVVQVLDYPQAVERGVIALPRPEVWPLLDDDLIEIVNGELKLAKVEGAFPDMIKTVVEKCKPFVTPTNETSAFQPWDRPTMFAVSSVTMARMLNDALNVAGLPAAIVTQETPRTVRNQIFKATIHCTVALVQIDVVSEGVDLPIRRLIDCKPTMSPVRWMQQIGRIARPLRGCMHHGSWNTYDPACADCEPPAEYYCTNRNLERHGYLFDGAMPAAYLKQAQDAFAAPTKRVATRAFGLEQFGRFQGAEIPLANGLRAHGYFLSVVNEFAKTQYAVLLNPMSTHIVYARRVNERDPHTMQFQWGKWTAIDAIPGDFRGFKSEPAGPLTVKQANWWQREAKYRGLSADASAVTKKNFPILPVLKDLGYRFT